MEHCAGPRWVAEGDSWPSAEVGAMAAQTVCGPSNRSPRRASTAPATAPFSRCPTSPSGADGSRRRHGPRQSSRCQVGGGNAGSRRVGPDIPCITRSSEARTRSGGVAPSRGSHHRHRNFLAKGKEEGRARSPGSGEGPNRVVYCRGQVASGERVDCSGRGSVASSSGRSSRCSSFRPTTDSTMRFCARVGSIASRSARVDARTGPVASRIVGPEWRGRTSQEVQIIGRAIHRSRVGFTTTGEGQGERPFFLDGDSHRSGGVFSEESVGSRWFPVTCNARYGLRGVRVGEASHPGPSHESPSQCPEEIVNCLEFDLTRVDTPDEEPSQPTGRNVVRRLIDHGESPRISSNNRFAALGDEEDRTVQDGSVESDTESCLEHNHQRPARRLRLVWRAGVASRRRGVREVRTAIGFVQDLARRIGFVPRGAQLPRALRQQRWSPLYVPMIWAAAGNEPSTPILDWLVEAAEQVREPVEFHGGQAVPSVCAREGFAALRGVLRSWRVADRDDLSNWLGSQGFPRSTPGSHISARAQDSFSAKPQLLTPGVRCWKQCSCWSR